MEGSNGHDGILPEYIAEALAQDVQGRASELMECARNTQLRRAKTYKRGDKSHGCYTTEELLLLRLPLLQLSKLGEQNVQRVSII